MTSCMIHAFLWTLLINASLGTSDDYSIAHSVFLPRAFDPFYDDYVDAITRMDTNELLLLPQLSDAEFLDQLVHGTDSIIAPIRVAAGNIFDPSLDDQLQYQGNIDAEWEDMMVGGPASINFMGVVMAIASRNDFPLKPDFTYKYVKYPTSYKATLVQVSNEMYRALFGAHTNMDRIQLNMRQIPALVKTALKLITQASPSMVKAMLPRTLTNIGNYANQSATAARSTLEQFEALRYLLEEIVEASTLTNKDNKDTADKLAKEAAELQKQKEAMDATLAKIREEYETARKDLEEARKKYNTAMLNVPGGEWDSYAWEVYAASRPAQTCSGRWFWRKCRSNRDQQFAEYSAEAKQKAQEALALLKEAEERCKELFQQQLGKQDDIGASMVALAGINFNEISINQTITILLDATRKIAIVQEQWSRLTRFFSRLEATTGTTQKIILESFIGAINDADLINQALAPSDKVLYVELLVEAATDIDRDAHMLFLMAKTYTDISGEFMVDQIAGLSGLLATQSDAERDALVKELTNRTQITSKKIKDLSTERQNKYELASYQRQKQYEVFIQEAMVQEELELLGGIGVGRR